MRSACVVRDALSEMPVASSPPITNILLRTRKFTSVPHVTCSSTSGNPSEISRTSWKVGTSGACQLRLDDLGLTRLGLDRHVRQPAEPAREPPVPVAEKGHRRGQEHAPDQRRVDEHSDREPEPELLD